jgi:[citrate (pro-3S)-lyase] ligase
LGLKIRKQENKERNMELSEQFKQSKDNLETLSQLAVLSAMGYTVPQWCLDNGINSVVIFMFKGDWIFCEQICAQFRMDKRVNVTYTTASNHTLFTEQFAFFEFIGQIDVKQYNTIAITSKETILFLSHQHIGAIDILRKKTGANVIKIGDILANMFAYSFYRRPLLEFKQKYPTIPVFCYNDSQFPWSARTDSEEDIFKQKLSVNVVKNGVLLTHGFDGLGYTVEEIPTLYKVPNSYYNNGIRCLEDLYSKYVNVINVRRVTTDAPATASRNIWILGGCRVFGIGAPDDKTIPSYLQKLLNKSFLDKNFAVQNIGHNRWKFEDDIFPILNSLPVCDGDIVIMHTKRYKISGMDASLDLANLFQRPHNYGEVFWDFGHYTERGNKVIAEKLFEKLVTENFFEASPHLHKNTGLCIPSGANIGEDVSARNDTVLPSEYAVELEKYKQLLFEHKPKIGAIVMNCNPFTLGHRYLAEYASQRVEHLYIFAIEEDKSIFPFKDRFKLIKAGTADLPNVTVLPSGKFIISSLTFTDYFNKSEIQDRVIDPSNDVTLFAEEIAPTLGITVRFAGEEPLDNVTRQYNDAMKRILPQHGIDFVVIPRKEADGSPISASRARALLEEKNFDEIAKIVPETTFEYLQKKYNGDQ